jgi:hypothetical protein
MVKGSDVVTVGNQFLKGEVLKVDYQKKGICHPDLHRPEPLPKKKRKFPTARKSFWDGLGQKGI